MAGRIISVLALSKACIRSAYDPNSAGSTLGATHTVALSQKSPLRKSFFSSVIDKLELMYR